MLEKKQCMENKTPGFLTLTPYHEVLQYHINRSNAIIIIFKQSLATNVDGKQTLTFADQVENILFEV